MIAPGLLVVSVRVLAMVGALALILSGECQPVFIGVFLLFFALAFIINGREKLIHFIGKAQPFGALLVLGISILDFFALSNSFLLSVAHFLLMVQGLRLLALQTARENLGSVLLSSLMMLSAATLSVDWTYFALFVVFIVMVIWTLMLHTLLEESRRNAAVTAAPLPLSNFVPYVRTSAAVGFVVAFTCCALVFLVFPRFNFQGFRGQFLQPVRKTGFVSQVNLAGGGNISQDDSVVMRIEIKPAERNRWSGYIRGQALEEFFEGVWRRPPGKAPVRAYRSYASEMNLAPNVRARGRALRQRIYLESMETPLLFAAPTPIMLSMDRPFVDVFADGAFQRIGGDTWRVRYDVDSYPSALDPLVIETASRKNQPTIASSKAATIETLAADISRGAKTSLEKAQRMSIYLQRNFTYSLINGPRAKRGEEAVNAFLFQTKSGHCEYFASALCLMLRAQGIESRMATGFLSREWNARGSYMVVRMRDAHAWVEAQMEDGSWIGLDPSPRAVETTPASSWFGGWSEAMDYMNLRWNRYILSYDFEKQVQMVQSVTNTSGSLSSRLGHWRRWTVSFKFWGSGPSDAVGVVTPATPLFRTGIFRVLLGIVALLVAGWFFLRRRATSAVWFYPALIRALERATGQKLGHETLREFSSKHANALKPNRNAFELLINAYYEMRFSVNSRVDAAVIRGALSTLNKSN